MRKSLLISLILVLLCSISAFAQEIDVENIIKSKEAEMQTLQSINQALNSVNRGYYKKGVETIASIATGLLPEPDFVIDEDTLDEKGWDYIVSILKDGSWKAKAIERVERFGIFVATANSTEDTYDHSDVWSLFSCIVFIVISMLSSVVFCSLSPVTALDTSKFETVINNKRNILELEHEVTVKEIIAPKVVHVTKANIKEKPAKKVEPAQDSPFKISYDSQEWLELGKGAMMELGSYSNNTEFKNVYSYFQRKTMVMSSRPFDISIAEADKAMTLINNKQTGEECILSALMKSKSSNKYAGSDIEKINSSLTSLDAAYLLSLSDSEGNNSKKELWSSNGWV